MIRDLLLNALEQSNLLEAFKSKPTFKAKLFFSTTQIDLIKSQDTVTISGESPDGAMTIRFCLDRNWLPLYFCVGESVAACDDDDLWERSDLAYVLGNDTKWEKHLSILGFASAEEIDGD